MRNPVYNVENNTMHIVHSAKVRQNYWETI